MNSRTGLHARPAARFVELAKGFESELSIEKDGRSGNAKSLVALLKLGISGGSSVTLRAEGPDEAEAVAAIIELLANLDEASDEGSDEASDEGSDEASDEGAPT